MRAKNTGFARFGAYQCIIRLKKRDKMASYGLDAAFLAGGKACPCAVPGGRGVEDFRRVLEAGPVCAVVCVPSFSGRQSQECC